MSPRSFNDIHAKSRRVGSTPHLPRSAVALAGRTFSPIIASTGGGSSVGRALRSQCRGRGFNSLPLHFHAVLSVFDPFVFLIWTESTLRGRGGIGRRAGFRSQSSQEGGGSSPLVRNAFGPGRRSETQRFSELRRRPAGFCRARSAVVASKRLVSGVSASLCGEVALG